MGYDLISGFEWLFIILVIVTLLIWGPKKIPELARSIGQARREFERGAKLPPVEEKSEKSSEDIIIETARKLGIQTEGKTKEEISAEIVALLREKKTKELS